MRAGAVWRTTAFRYAALFAVLFVVSLWAAVGALYYGTIGVIQAERDAALEAEIGVLAERFRAGGTARLIPTIEQRLGPEASGDRVYLLLSPTGRRLAGNLSGWPQEAEARGDWLTFPVQKRDGAELTDRSVRARSFMLPGDHWLLVGRDNQELVEFRRRFLITGGWVAAAGVLVGLLAGLIMGRRVLARVQRAAEAGAGIAAGHLDRRLPVTGTGDEFDRLAEALNAMLDRIEQLMAGMRIATDGISHDLRRPLTRARAELELAAGGAGGAEALRAAAARALEDIDAAAVLLSDLLRLAQAEAALPGEGWGPVDLAELAGEAAELYQPLAEERGIAFETRLEPAEIIGDGSLLAQALANLIDNALKYAPPREGRITLGLARDAAAVVVEVADNGPGIAEADRARVTGRFVRLDPARSDSGAGLGLSLVAAVARLHGGHLTLDDGKPGLIARLTLPAPQAAAVPAGH